MTIRGHGHRGGFENIPDENLEIPTDLDDMPRIVKAAIFHALNLYPGVSESKMDYLIDLSIRSFKAGIDWYSDKHSYSMKTHALGIIPSLDKDGSYDAEELEVCMLAMTAGVDWYIKNGSVQ